MEDFGYKGFYLTKTLNINCQYPVSVIFIDPPYKINIFNDLLVKIIKNKLIQKNTIIVAELDKKTSFFVNKNLSIIKEKIYGKTKIMFLKKL